MKKILTITLIIIFKVGYSQLSDNELNKISLENIKNTIDTLTSPSFEGRGITAIDNLVKYFSNYYLELGLQPIADNNFNQDFNFFSYLNYSNNSYLKIGNEKMTIGKDFIHSLSDFKFHYNYTREPIQSKLFFVGNSNQTNDSILNIHQIKGKVLVVFDQSRSLVEIAYRNGATGIIIIEPTKKWFNKTKQNLEILGTAGGVLSYLQKDPLKRTFTRIHVTTETGAKILGVTKSKLKQYRKKYTGIEDSSMYKLESQIELNIHRKKKVYESANLIGFIPGYEKNGEHIILSAHYDHLGKNERGYFPGANDNASGIASLLEISRILSENYKAGIVPKRSILFIAFGMEEARLMGSKYYTENPILPLSKLKANINLDMIGRQDKYHLKESNYIYALGPDSISSGLNTLMDSINNVYQFVKLEHLDNFPNAKKFFSKSSDQASFLNKGIPAILITNGMQSDLHRFTDTKEKIYYPAVKNI
ncbi:M28 family metallopeptidase [Marinifilum sp. D737]|uniref:M28 family metallopeptidase n=1 Tax=Marinifilum sp. D737 TaxID=2969628 RepID=UPI0022760807|nr:M28 family peptidase [Marinifilum sp. D737]MCY1634602.1 M28 family peptidase [Marinifilum sp. D737]